MKYKVILTLLLLPTIVLSQNNSPKPITWKDVSGWKYISMLGVQASPDGQWLVSPLVTVEGDGELIVQKIADEASKKSYPIGSTTYPSVSFSEDGKWLAFKEYPKNKDKKAAAKNPAKPLFEKLILVELSTGKKTEFEKVNSFAFNGKLSTHLAMLLANEKAGGNKADDPTGSDLLVVELSSGKSQNIGNVNEYAFNKPGTLLAYTINAANQSGNGLLLYTVATRSTHVLESDKANYRSINWNEEGTGLAALKMVKDKKYKQDHGSVIGVKDFTIPTIVVYDPKKDSTHFPANLTISANRKPMWTKDLSRLLFGVQKLKLAKKTDKESLPSNKDSITAAEKDKIIKLKADTSIHTVSDLQKAISKLDTVKKEVKSDTVKPDMTIWHWQDSRLQSLQQVMENQDKNFSYLAMYNTTSGKYVQMNDSTTRYVSVLPKELYALAEDRRAYELDSNLDGQSYSDWYIIDLKTGERFPVFKRYYQTAAPGSPRFSPDGTKFLYGEDGQYWVYDIPARHSTNLTGNIPASFINTEDDHNVKKPMIPPLGWSSNNKYVFLRDLWDIWQVPVTSGKEIALNLTENGKKEKVRYQFRYTLDPEEKGYDLKKPQYVRMYGEWSKKSGIACIEPGKNGLLPGAKKLIWQDASVNLQSKTKNAEVYLYSLEKFNQPSEMFAADAVLGNAKQVTHNTPDKDKYQWSEGVQLVDYLSDKGDTLQGALFLPAGYEKGKKYPTIVYYYEKMSQSLYNYTNPGFPGGGWNPTVYTSNGYAVFMPDIVYKLNDPGMSAVWCVLPAVKAAIKTGIVDESRIGITGHSWGGYQTCFLITQTNMFKAAAAGAPLTNMISMYDLIYRNSGGGNMSIFEASQGRFTGGPWDNWEAYLRNSPVYHVKDVTTPLLLLHNDKDGAVDETQGIEFYNALRRLKKPVVWIEYKGENHGLSKLENRKDYAVRMMEFFDYHLKGKPAPEWLSHGVDRLDLNDHLEKRVFENGGDENLN